MAREKPNIAREEIHSSLFGSLTRKKKKNTFPNIPRLTEHFGSKDGRRCSNNDFWTQNELHRRMGTGGLY